MSRIVVVADKETLDPEDWEGVRADFHAAVDGCLDYLRTIRDRPVWLPVPEPVKAKFRAALPGGGEPLGDLLTFFKENILPYGTGNTHPRFFGWVHGSGCVAGVMGELLASFMNCNAGGRDHIATYVERQVVDWCKEIFSFPGTSSGIVTSGTSMGTLIAFTVARNDRAAGDIQKEGLSSLAKKLVGYTSSEAHCCLSKSFEILGLGRDALRTVAVDADGRMDVADLARLVEADISRGFQPILVAASAGTVNTGAIDDLDAIADVCQDHSLWMHVDGAFGGLAILTPEYKDQLAAISRADSIAFDFHKWLHVPYDAGCVLIKNEEAHRSSFSARREYLAAVHRGLAGGNPWFCEYGPELSRGFRALKVWFTIMAHGVDRLAEMIARNCRQASYLGELVRSAASLELLSNVTLNIVCFRFIARGIAEAELDELNAGIVADLQLSGVAAPSTTRIHGKLAIRAALTNHRTRTKDLDILAAEVCRLGKGGDLQMSQCANERGASGNPSESSAPHEAPRSHPDAGAVPVVMGLAKLATAQFSGRDIMAIYRQLAARLEQDSSNVAPLMDVAILDQLLGCTERGLAVQSAALRAQRLYRLASDEPAPRLRLLGFATEGPLNANMPVEFLIEDSDVTLYVLYVVPGMPLPPMPEHDIAIVLAAESELARPVLNALERLLERWPRPVLNRPHHVPGLGRESLYRLLAHVDGIVIPVTERVDCAALASIGDGTIPIGSILPDGGFPIIARPIDSHGGHGLEKIETQDETAAYLVRNPVSEYFLSRFIDYRSPDSRYRKYRIAVIDGVPYASHLAISDHWMVHFLNASMSENADKRREEEQFMDRFREDFAARHGPAFAEMAARSQLEYFGVDCGETLDGKLLVFEADTSLIVHDMDSPVEFPYKRRHMRRLFAAFREMLYGKTKAASAKL